MNVSRKDVFYTHKNAYARAARKRDVQRALKDSSFSFNWNFGDLELAYEVRVSRGRVSVIANRNEDAVMEYYNKLYSDFHEYAMGISDGKEAISSGRFKWKGYNRFLGLIAPLTRAMRIEYKKLVEKKVVEERERILEERKERKKQKAFF